MSGDPTKVAKKPLIPRPSIRQSLGNISKSSVSKALTDVIGNKENAPTRESRRLSSVSVVKSNTKEKQSGPNLPPTKLIKVASVAQKTTPSKAPPATVVEKVSSSPTSRIKVTSSMSTSTASSSMKLRDSTTSSLPKYKPKATLAPPKPAPTRRKRRNSLDETLEEEENTQTNVDLSNRPISPLPRRSRLPSSATKISELKITVKPPAGTPEQRTPVRLKLAQSTPSSISRVRTLSTATTGSIASTRAPDTPLKRTEKRARLSSEGAPRSRMLASSTSTITADVSSDSIDLADVSALMDIRPNLSPMKAMTPSSARRIVVKRTPITRNESTTPSRKPINGSSTRQNMSYLSPPSPNKVRASPTRPPLVRGNTKGRGSILSWTEFSDPKLEEDSHIISESAPFPGPASTPGSDKDEGRSRGRMDSGWELDSPFLLPRDGPSIGQVMFPTLSSPLGSGENPPDGDAVVARLLQVKLTQSERDVRDLQNKIKHLEAKLANDGGSTATKNNLIEMEIPENNHLHAMISLLETDLENTQLSLLSASAELEKSSNKIQQLEDHAVASQSAWEQNMQTAQEQAVQALLDAETRSAENLQKAISSNVASEQQKWERKTKAQLELQQTGQMWSDVKRMAMSDMESVHRMQETLRVFALGLEVTKALTIHD